MSKNIGVIVGSLRKASWNRKLALALMQVAPATLNMELTDISQLPLYNQDLDDEGRPPAAWTTFRDTTKSMDGILFVTPEYNRSIPSPMKNAIDVGSRPYGKSVWNNKPSAVISGSPGAIGGFGANQHLRQSLVTLNVPCMAGPEAYIASIDKLFDEKGNIANDSTRDFLRKFIEAYSTWIDTLSTK